MIRVIILISVLFIAHSGAQAFHTGIDSTSVDSVSYENGMTITNIDTLLNNAKSLFGVKYKYGGMDQRGFDCSGFLKFILAKSKVPFPRVAADQFCLGNEIDSLHNTLPGDLLFFKPRNRTNRIAHVGIVSKVENGLVYMIHASSSRGITEICYSSSSYFKSRFVGIKRWWF